jgi:hypothetical protein
VSDERVLALLLATSGLGLGGWALMREPTELPNSWYQVIWPREVDAEGVIAFLRSLAGDRRRHVVVLEVVGTGGAVSYRIGLSDRLAVNTLASLRSFVPGTVTKLIDNSVISAPRFAWEMTLSTRSSSLRIDTPEQISRALLTTLATTKPSETIVVQWLLGPRLAPARIGAKPTRPTESWADVLRVLGNGSQELNNDQRKALQGKVGEAGFRAIGRIGIAGTNEPVAQALASRMLTALRQAEAPGVHVGLKRVKPDRIAEATPGRRWELVVNVRELAALSAFPLGDGSYPGLNRSRSKLLKSAQPVVRNGRVAMVSTYPGDERPLVLGAEDAKLHTHLIGPTGVGKSTLMLSLAIQDIEAGRGVVVVDPKGDLIEDILARAPQNRLDDIVVIDPSDEMQPVGLNVLRGSGRSPELIADQVLAVFHGLYKDNWGPRLQDILHASLLTIAGQPGMTLCSLPVLLSNERYRARIVAGLTDEIALKPFWHWFDSISEGERQQAIAPVMNKLRAFLLRPRMRAVIGQAEPRFDLTEVFTKKKVVLVSLAKGLLGPEAAALLGSLVVSQVWQAALAQVRVPVDRRPTVMLYADEFQEFLNLPTDVADVLAQARGLGLGMTLAHQHLAQLTPVMRSAVMANARSRICFQLSHDDAKAIAAMSPELSAEDLQGLPRFEAYASLVHGGVVQPYASGRTAAPTERTIDPENVRARSRQTYGRPIAEVEAELATLINGEDASDDKPVGRRRRT